MPVHHFSIDVEEYYHPSALADRYPRSRWDDLPRRSPAVVERLLGWLDERGVRGTFFILGWLAEREPDMVQAVAAAGHEIASHGWAHQLVGDLGPEGFRESVARSRDVLQELSGVAVVGYRAPSFSIVPGLEWAFDILIEEGYRYDASLFPISQHPTYGYPSAELYPYWIERPAGRLLEIPSTTARLMGNTLPASGGAYFRLFPYALVRSGMRQAMTAGAPGTFYIHPWELDDWAPRMEKAVPWVRTFWGRKRTWGKMNRMFNDFDFGPIVDTLKDREARSEHSGEATDGA